MPNRRSLEHAAFKSMATNWSFHAEYDNTYLATLPASARVVLMSYLAVYDEAHWPNPFPLLFPIDCEQDELDAVTRLDLTNSIGGWATNVKKIEKELVVQKEMARHKTGVPLVEHDRDHLPESWDDEQPDSPISTTAHFRTMASSRFVNLKHLSLAINLASSSAPPSWTSLISLSAHLSQLNSLSLAHWPTPTYTPNAAKGRVKMVNPALPSLPNQPFGGTNLYTGFDKDWREAAGILRSLSRNLYCLTWLDLSGCGEWLMALTWHDENGELASADWNGAWRNITNLMLGVGWVPGRPPSLEDEISSSSRSTSSIDSTRAIEQLYGGSENIQASLSRLSELRLTSDARQRDPSATDASIQQPWNVEHERAKQYFKKDVERYAIERSTAKEVSGQIRVIRKAASGRYIDFELGPVLGPDYSLNQQNGF